MNSLSVGSHLLNMANWASQSPEIIQDAREIRKHFFQYSYFMDTKIKDVDATVKSYSLKASEK